VKEEPWYGTKFQTELLGSEKLESWAGAALHPNLHLPEKNDFIPTDFTLVERDSAPSSHPVILHKDEMGRLWYKQDDEFLLPKTCINVELKSPIAYMDPHHANLTYMFVMLFKDQLNEYVYAAELAGLGYSLSNIKAGVTLALKGYNEKQGVLLDKIMEKLAGFTVDEKRFHVLKEAYARGLKNFQAEQPHQHAVYYNSVVLSERVWHKEELMSALERLTVEEVTEFIPRLLGSLHIECMVYGNCTAESATKIYTGLVDKLKQQCATRALLPSQLIKEREVELKDVASLYTTTNAVHKSSCIESYYQTGLQDTKLNMLLELFSQIINEGCYNQLRTQEQLGYIVFSGVRRSNGAQGFRVIVQSERHPEYLDSRIEAFLGSLEKSLGELEEEEFKKQVEALATKRLERPKKLSVRNGRYWSEILSQHYNFDRDAVEVEVLRGLTKEDVLMFYRTHIADTSSRRKLSCQVVSTCEGGAGHPDTKTEEPLEAENGLKESRKPRIVTDITAFKSSLPLFPLAQPSVHPDKLFRANP
jgi:insulysin